MFDFPELDLPETKELALIKYLRRGPSLLLGQSWLPRLEPEFEPGTVSIAWCAQGLAVLAELRDTWIHNEETEHNASAYLRGDTFEIFLRNRDRRDYWEFHVTPQNVILQAHFPTDLSTLKEELNRQGKSYRLKDYLVVGRKFFSHTWIEEGGWNVFALIPFELLGLSSSRDPSLLSAHFARYDYPRGRLRAVLSSTARFSDPPNFHDQSGWSYLSVSRRFRNRARLRPQVATEDGLAQMGTSSLL